MASNKLRLQSFRTNDLVNDGGKQFELGKSWCDDFFEFDKTRQEVVVDLKFKAIQMSHVSLNDKIIELKLADVSIRGDRKAYVNGNNGMSQIKDFFINDLHLTPENNLTDYFAIYKVSEFDYYLYFVPSLLYKNFLQFFKSVLPTVSINHNNEDLRTAEKASLQQIFYGAPGTGKSHEVKTRTGELSNDEERDLPNVFRTTFHPDTDYASFVGCYKPSMRKTGKKHQVDGKDVDDEEIIYEFVPQTFTDAYVYAYKNPTLTTYLVIEEINRGNCAQIFGDLFQLLDRKNGVSEYKIKADKDLAKYLNEELGKDADGIKDGKLCLPANLCILATMNTSDQSLFPMDSAFKRRWEWKYIKIADAHKDWKIETNGEDWYGFICQINRIISNMTSSADKQLGYFFCQANEDRKITTETFVSKVIFYLWNDVFKDYGFEDTSLFKYKKVDKDGNRFGDDLDLTFPDFYDEDGNVAPDVVAQFIEHVMAWEKDKKKDNN